jgi:hypothetical protein
MFTENEMKIIQYKKYLPKVTVVVNGNGNLLFYSIDELANNYQNHIEISKELFIKLITYNEEILDEMNKNRVNCLVDYEEGENDA